MNARWRLLNLLSVKSGLAHGDPIVVYDHIADRWLLSQFADPNHMCVAISQTPDPTAGTWFLYTFNTLNFPDYPKFGVWPNGYFMSSYERNPGALLALAYWACTCLTAPTCFWASQP